MWSVKVNVFNACANTLILSFFPVWGLAEESVTKGPDVAASAGTVAIFLLLTIGIIFLLAWLATKARAIRPMSGHQAIRPVATLSLGVKERLALVQVGEKQILLGITAHQITALAEFDEPVASEASSSASSFSEVLKKAIHT